MGENFTLDAVPQVMTAKDEAFKQEKKGQKDRIGLCWFPTDEEGEWDRSRVQFKFEQVYYIKEHGYVIWTEEIEEVMGEPPKARAGTVVCQYDTNKKGEVTEPFEYEVKPWFLNGQKVDALKEHNTDKPLHKVDLVVKCTGPNYASMEFFPKSESFWQLKAEKEVLSKARIVARKLKIARKVSTDDVREMLGIEVAASTIGGSGSVDEEEFDDMLDDE